MSDFNLTLCSFVYLVEVFIMLVPTLFSFCSVCFFSVSFCLFYTTLHAVQIMDVRCCFFFKH